MDVDVQRMMADLGIARRDYVSAPEEGGRRRFNPRQELDVLTEAEHHRAQAQQLHEDDDPRSAVINKWNTQATFGVDDVAEALENRFSGQGHRAALRLKVLEYPDRDRDGEPRDFGPRGRYHAPRGYPGRELGDERQLYLQQHNYTFAPPPGAAAHPSRQRASSPRASGTVRFGPGGVRREQRPRSLPLSTTPLPANTALHGALAQMRAAGRVSQLAAQEPSASTSVTQPPVSSQNENLSPPALVPITQTSATPTVRTDSASTTPSSTINMHTSLAVTPILAQTTRASAASENPQIAPAPVQVTTSANAKRAPGETTRPTVTQTDKQPKAATTITPLSLTTNTSAGPSSIPSRATSNLSSPAVDVSNGHILTASFYTSDGRWAGTQQYPIQAPVTADIKIMSQLPRFNPATELADAMMDLSKAMRDRSRGIEGFMLSDDGLWEETDD